LMALPLVITGLVPVISMREVRCLSNRDGRDRPGHDEGGCHSRPERQRRGRESIN
jgi:hypothetical protein